MHRSLRHFARTPHLRVLAWLAWLILAVAPVHGAPGGMMGDAHAHDMSATASGCCTGQALHGPDATNICHCAATCASVLPVLAMAELAPPSMHAMPVPRHGEVAPSVTRSPPLRPPLLQTSRLS